MRKLVWKSQTMWELIDGRYGCDGHDLGMKDGS